MLDELNVEFSAWVSAVEEQGRRALRRSDTDMTWFIGGMEDWRRGFQAGMSAEEYVLGQLTAWTDAMPREEDD